MSTLQSLIYLVAAFSSSHLAVLTMATHITGRSFMAAVHVDINVTTYHLLCSHHAQHSSAERDQAGCFHSNPKCAVRQPWEALESRAQLLDQLHHLHAVVVGFPVFSYRIQSTSCAASFVRTIFERGRVWYGASCRLHAVPHLMHRSSLYDMCPVGGFVGPHSSSLVQPCMGNWVLATACKGSC